MTIIGNDDMIEHYLRSEAEGRKDDKGTLCLCMHALIEDTPEGTLAPDVMPVSEVIARVEEARPAAVVYVSSWQVYSPDAGEGVDESRPTFARTHSGRLQAQTELALEKWCHRNGTVLTIVRPAIMFGNGIAGSMHALFNRAVRGHYVHIRGNESRVSLVTALDAARAIVRLAGCPGIFNITDGRSHRWIDLVEAMTANAGARKRMTHLPEKWAEFIYRWFGALPIVEECLSPAALQPFARTLVLDGSKAAETTGINFHDTLAVIARTDSTYPYSQNMAQPRENRE